MGVDQGSQAQIVDMDKLSEPNETGLPRGGVNSAASTQVPYAGTDSVHCSGLICPDTSIGGQSTIRGDLYDKATPQFRPQLQA